MKIEPFKMEVTPLQSMILQKFLLAQGYKWSDGSDEVFIRIKHRYLFFQSGLISMTNNETQFIFDQLPEIKFSLFEGKYIVG